MRPAFAVAFVSCALLLLVVILLRPDARRVRPTETPDWEMVATCVWERWDQAEAMEETARKIEFCVTVDPHSLPPGQIGQTRQPQSPPG